MSKYIVVAPNGQNVRLSCQYGEFNFVNGQIVENDRITELFSSIFVRLPDEPVKENIEVLIETPEIEQTEILIKEEISIDEETKEIEQVIENKKNKKNK